MGRIDAFPSALMGAANDPWIDYVPTLSNITIGNGILTAAYTRIGRTIHYRIKFVFGSTSAMGSSPAYTLPVAPNVAYIQFCGMANDIKILDNGTTVFQGTTEFASGSTVTILASLSAGAGIVRQSVTATVPMTWAVNDTIFIIGTYEAAS